MKSIKKGFTLIEILVVITVFALIGLIASQSVVATLRGARSADTEAKIRQNLDYALGIVERNLHNAASVTCPNTLTYRIDFVDPDGNPQWFAQSSNGTDVYIAHSNVNNRLTSNQIRISSFTVTCVPGTGNVPTVVNIAATATDPIITGPEGATISTQIKVVLRTNK